MLHTKTKVARNMIWWEKRCKESAMPEYSQCNVGFPYPKEIVDYFETASTRHSEDGWAYNCFCSLVAKVGQGCEKTIPNSAKKIQMKIYRNDANKNEHGTLIGTRFHSSDPLIKSM